MDIRNGPHATGKQYFGLVSGSYKHMAISVQLDLNVHNHPTWF